jgi:ABC-2 type transport system permease protein
MYCYTDGLAAGGSMDLSKYGLSLGGLDWLIILVSMFLGIICALGMCMVLGAFAKNYKAAQTMTMPISMLAMVPMFVMIFTSYGDLPGILQGVIFAIPFSHPMMAMQNLMFGDMTLVAAGLVYMALFALAMIYITVRIYRSDILITGFTKEDFKRMFSMKGRRGAGRS